jgi:hypothetical protein
VLKKYKNKIQKIIIEKVDIVLAGISNSTIKGLKLENFKQKGTMSSILKTRGAKIVSVKKKKKDYRDKNMMRILIAREHMILIG